MTVLSFEKPDALKDHQRVASMRAQCEAANVEWRPEIWHNKPIGIVATVYDLVVGCFKAIRIAKEVKADIVHCRSYIAGAMGLAVKRATGAKYIFDMRGFWPDERVDGNILSKSSLTYKVFKRLEKSLFLNADHVVSLTMAGVREFEKFEYLKSVSVPSSVIPTCTNMDMFRPVSMPQDGFTLGYVGSARSWYLFDEVAKAIARAFELKPDARFLVVTKSSHDVVREKLQKANVDLDRVEICSADFSEVGNQIARMDAGIFFIRPAWSKRASCPTRLGEFLACGKPCLANGGVGDVASDLTETQTGRSGDKTLELFRIVHCVVSGNNWLKDAAIKAGAEKAVTLEVAEDTDRIPMHAPHTNAKPVTIGWLGSPTTVKYLRLIEPVLQRLARKYPDIRWEIIGGSEFNMPGVDWTLHNWTLDGELEALARFDIGLMPLPLEDWSLGKSGGKARTYMAAGVVPIVSAIGYNNELIRHGETGFLCKTEDDWERYLVRAIEDADLRQTIASEARKEVEDRFDPRSTAQKMAELLKEVVQDVESR